MAMRIKIKNEERINDMIGIKLQGHLRLIEYPVLRLNSINWVFQFSVLQN